MIWVMFIKILKNTIQIRDKVFIIFDYMIADMLINKFIGGRNLCILLVFVTKSRFAVLKNITLKSTHYFVMKISNKRELQQVAFNHSSDIDFQDFIKFYKKCTEKPYSFSY